MNLVLLLLGAFAVFLVARSLWFARPGITPDQALADINAGRAVLVDVREPSEWSTGVAKPAALLSLSDLRGPRASWRPFLDRQRGKQLVLYCASGARSGQAAALLRREGFPAVNLGGFSRWAAAGLPVARPKR